MKHSKYDEALQLFKRARYPERGKPIAGNTRVVAVEPGDRPVLGIKLHETIVVQLYPNGTTVIDDGGWLTCTTKDRINQWLPNGWSLWGEKGVWLIGNGARKYRYGAGFTIGPRGGVRNEGTRPAKEIRELRDRARKYAKNYVTEFLAGKVPAPGPGDCWHCQFTVGKVPLGDTIKDQDHLLMHLDEGYYVPSLLVNATRAFPASMFAMNLLAYKWNPEYADKEPLDIELECARRDFSNSIRRYLLRGLGEVSR